MSSPGDLTFDFRSDTFTLPSAAMKAAMTDVELGDDVYGEDPTVQALQQRIANLTGMEDALFFPSGCMANLTALLSQTRPGQTIFAGAHSHIKCYELNSYARIAGLGLDPVDDTKGYLDLPSLKQAWPPDAYDMPEPGLVAVENTHNMLGGVIYPPEKLHELRRFARERGVPLHMDGARLMNASRAADRPVRDWTQHVDSVMISVSKGLGAPVGSVLAASKPVIEKALRFRKQLGGGMRQAGVLAGAALFALDHHLPSLDRDHQRCRHVFEGVQDLGWLNAVAPQTNILVFYTHAPIAPAFQDAMAEAGIKLFAIDDRKVRVVFHLNIADTACDRLIELMRGWRPPTP